MMHEAIVQGREALRAGPLKGPRGPFLGRRGPLKGPRGPFKGPRVPFKGWFPGRPGPPRPRKSTISGLSKNQILKNPRCVRRGPEIPFVDTYRKTEEEGALGFPGRPGKTFQKVRGETLRLFRRFPGRPGPPRPRKSTISGRPKNDVLKTQV